MAKNKEPAPPTEAEALAQLPPELREFDRSQWPAWSDWSRARNSALYKTGYRRLPAIRAMLINHPKETTEK